ncbi:MAG: NAD(P)-dependent oxidoreductase [Polyangiales bacterium]
MAICAFIGLGNMGFPMAGPLVARGHEVRVFNRTAETCRRWVDTYGGEARGTPAEAAEGAGFVFVCVSADDDVRGVLYGNTGALEFLNEGAIVVDHTTASPDLATELSSACERRGIGFIDGPISGGQAGAERGALSVMCGGERAHFEDAAPIMAAYAAKIVLVGPVGSGQRTKMVNQILCAGVIQGVAEGLAFGERVGLDMEKVLAAVSGGAAGSWYLTNRGATMVADDFDFGFAVDLMAKDLRLVASEAAVAGAAVPLTKLTSEYLGQAQQAGDARLDATAIIRRYRDSAHPRER